MALTRLDNLISSKTGKYLYVSPDDFNASDELNNRGNSPIRPFKSIQRAFLEIARYSYLPGPDNDRFDQFTIMLMPGIHYIDNRPGLADVTGIDEFSFDQALSEWTDSSNLDIGDPNNVLYKFNNTEGGAIIPRGSSMIGYDLRRTAVHPLFVPDPADRLEKRSAIFNVTGGCYFWQMTIRDGDLEPSSPLYDQNEGVGKVYYQNGKWDQLAVPKFSHHKLTVFEYADKEELGLYYQKVAKAFSHYQPTIDDPNEFGDRVQETRIVGPLSDIRSIESIKLDDKSTDPSLPASTVEVEITSKVNHGYFKNQFVTIENNGLDDSINGTFSINEIDLVDGRVFRYRIPGVVAALGTTGSLTSGTTYFPTSTPPLDANAVVKAEVDTVESASPYVFNCSIRSTWGICGIWANGLKATGFKSMVIAQYTGVSLQKDDRAFIRYDEYTNTFNQAALTDAFATVPYHTKGDAYWKDDWRNFHVRASEDAFIQCVSIFAVGYADHFLMESGGDMSITNSNSNFGNTSLHAKGHKGYAFTQDKGGYITDIVPPEKVVETAASTKKNPYYTLDIKASNDALNHTKIYLGDDNAYNPAKRPAATIDGFRLGARSQEEIFVKLTPATSGAPGVHSAKLSPSGFKRFTATADILNPTGVTVNNADLDAANRIEENKNFIAHEAYGYITAKYPTLLTKEGITIEKCRRDIGYLIDATVQDLRLGGNINTIQAAESYFVNNALSYINHELNETLEGYYYARDLAIASLRNFTYLRKSCETNGTAFVNIGDTSGVVQGMTVADYDPSQFTADNRLDPSATRPVNPVIPDNTFVKRVVDSATIEIGQKATYSEKKVVSDRFGDSRNLILTNKAFIAAEAFDRMVLDYPGYTSPSGYTSQDCLDDIIDAIEAIAENVGYGGNAETFDAAYHYESGAVVYLAQKKDETIRCYEYAKDMCIQVLRNEDVFVYGTHGVTQTKDSTITYEPPELVNDRNGDARDLLLANKNLIAHEAVERMVLQSSTATYTPTAATYDATTGDLELTIVNHGLNGATTSSASNAAYDAATGVLTITVANHGFVDGDRVQIADGSLSFTCSMDANATTHTYPRATDPVSGKWVDISNVTTNTFDVNVGDSPVVSFTPTNASYDPTTGLMEITVGNHGLSVGTNVQIAQDSLTFTCAQDSHATQHTYPRASDPASKSVPITAVTTTTITVQVLPSAPSTNTTAHTFVSAAANAVRSGGNYSHTFVTASANGISREYDSVRFDYGALTFTCDMDQHGSDHVYPRVGDPAGNSLLPVGATTSDTITVNVGKSLTKTFDVSDASYNETTGDLTLTIDNHSLVKGTSIRLADNSLTFTCSQDSHATQHQYPRTTVDTFTATDASYNPTTGIVTVTVANHGFVVGDQVKLADDSLTFTCGMDGDGSNHTYPRSSDPISGQWITLSSVTANTFDIQVLDSVPSTNTSVHTFVSATAGGVSKKRDKAYQNALTITDIGSSFKTATGAVYDPATGIMEVTSPSHGFVAGDRVKISEGSLTFTCAFDNNATEHAYPRLSDPNNDTWLEVSDVGANTFTVNVGAAGANQTFTPGAATTYDPSSGDLVLDIGSHALTVGEGIVIDDGAVSLTCTMDGNQVAQSYPRAGKDKASQRSLPITSVTDTTVTINVGNAGTNKYFTPTAATYDQANGDLTVTIGQHGLAVGSDITLKNNSLTFSCDKDANASNHSYPRPGTDPWAGKSISITSVGSTQHTITGASYTPTTGVLTLSIPTHGFSNGDYIKIADNSLTLTCDLDGNVSQKAYPRAGFDYPSGRWLQVSNVVANAFEVNVGSSSDASVHTFVSATTNGLEHQDGTLTFNVGFDADVANQYDHTFVSALADAIEYEPQSPHTFVSGVTDSVKHLPQSAHTFKRAATNGIEKQGGSITVNVGIALAGQQFSHDFVTATAGAVQTGGNYTHTFKSAVDNSVHRIFSVGGSRAYHNIDCVDDVVDLVEAIADNVAYGGNDKTWDAAYSYKTGAHVVGEESETNYVFEQAKEMAAQVIRNQKVLCIGSHGLHQQTMAITEDIPEPVQDRFGDARNLIEVNKNLIAEEAYARMILQNPGFLPPTGNPQDCKDDILDFVTEVAYNVGYGGNDRVYDMANLYVTGAHVAGEEEQTLAAFEEARMLMVQALRQEKILCVGSHGESQTYDNALTVDAQYPQDNRVADAKALIDSNKVFIAEIAKGRMVQQYPNHTYQSPYTVNDCLDDLKDVVDVVAHNLAYGGNDRVWDCANFYVAGNASGADAETIYAFNQVRDIILQVITNDDVTVGGHTGLSQVKDLSITNGVVNGDCDNAKSTVTSLVKILTDTIASHASLATVTRTDSVTKCEDVRSALNTLTSIATNAISDATSLTGSKAWVSDASYNPTTGVMELTIGSHSYNVGDPVAIANGSLVFTCAQDNNATQHAYPRSTDPLGSTTTVITAKTNSTISVQVLNTQPSTNTTAHTFVSAIDPISIGGVKRTRSLGKCNDLRNTIDTLFNIVQSTVLTPSSLDSVTRTVSNGSCQNVASSVTTLFKIITDTIKNPGYLQSIERVESPLGLAFGPAVNATATTTNTYIYFTLDSGVYTAEYSPTTDDTITQDTLYPQCNTQSDTIRQYFSNIGTIIQNGLTINGLPTVARQQPASATSTLSSRSTLWTLSDWTVGTTTGSNPHDLETGTIVRLVPRPRWDPALNGGSYVDVDKRNIRLPNGFTTNTKYYVIAPGRTTKPEDYSSTTDFNGSKQTGLMLASSKENAAAGIYIHSAEVEGIHPDVEIDFYQFVLDDKYDLHQYKCVLDSAVNDGIRTDVPHIFDIPFANISGHQVFVRENEGGSVPLVGTAYAADPTVAVQSGPNVGRIRQDVFFWARYQNEKVFTLHTTKADAINNVNQITFQPGSYDFSAFADKRTSPMRYDPSYDNPTNNFFGKWYLNVENESTQGSSTYRSQSILKRFHDADYNDASGKDKTNDSWFDRVNDDREADERIYRLRYVIPKYLKSVRDPLNGFTIKVRKDETRKLLPQKLVLKPVVQGSNPASFYNPVQATEKIGYTTDDFVTNNLSTDIAYDPYKKDLVGNTSFVKTIETTNYISMSVQSGRYVNGNLELTVFDQGVTNTALLNETFTTVKITAPQGGTTPEGFTADKSTSGSNPNAATRVDWFGNSSGYAYVHAVLNVPGTSEWHLILKGVVGKIDYSSTDNIRFTQGSVFADLLGDPDYGKSLYIKDLIKKGYPEYYYRQNGAPVYTITPGDKITDDANIQYYVESVSDAGEIDDTFYIFDNTEIQKRIFGQQDGIYYLTAVRGNMSPYPTGAGNLGNFRDFKFSQPISKLYPLNYKNDPLWYQVLPDGTRDTGIVDPPQTYSAADNYIHGLVTVNDFKGSMTKEAVEDLVSTSALSTFAFKDANTQSILLAQAGNAASGSEDRLIPITGYQSAGTYPVVSQQRMYVELRRPSIARAGNHTFEYLGFGPGNYSTGMPVRQEVVLEPIEDFYAQSKKEDGGLVFYTGLNSNGDLYIGNRKIDAITGEEEFLESAKLVDSEDDEEDIGNLVTTFDTPVTFNEYITVVGGDDGDKTSTFNSPVQIVIEGQVRKESLTIVSNVDPSYGDDASLDTAAQQRNPYGTLGHIVLTRNRISASVFQINPRGSEGSAQGYRFQNHASSGYPVVGSNVTPDQSGTWNATQIVQYGNAGGPLTGDVLFKGSEVGRSGSLGWIFANYYRSISGNVESLTCNGTLLVTITWQNNITNDQLEITSGSKIRIGGLSDNIFNDVHPIDASSFQGTNDWIKISIPQARASISGDSTRLWSSEPNATMEFSTSDWKEVGVLGSESIRTETETIGDYKVGINTVERAGSTAWQTNFVDDATSPRANLDVVGTAFISGVKAMNFVTNFPADQRQYMMEENAFLVGGQSSQPDYEATFRISTAKQAVGINVSSAELDRALVVDGLSRYTNDAKFEQDIEVHGGGGVNTAEIRTNITTGTFNFLMDTGFTGLAGTPFQGGLHIAGSTQNIALGNVTTDEQHIHIGGLSTDSNINIGSTTDGPGTNESKIVIGGAYASTESLSYTQIGSKSLKVDGDQWLGYARTINDSVNLASPAGTVGFFSNSGGPSTINFALNASEINIAGQGGVTTINNQLEVAASAKFNSNIHLCGGSSSFSFLGDRGQMGSTITSHDDGIITAGITYNKNVDILNVLQLANTEEGYNQIDTAGGGPWHGTAYQQLDPSYNLPTLTGDEYYLPLKYQPVKNNGDQYFAEGDYVLVDSPIVGTTGHPEVVQIINNGLSRTNDPIGPWFIAVKRQPFGTFTGVVNTHPDTTAVFKVNVQFDSTWTEQTLDDTGPQDNVYLAEFGGELRGGIDYIIVGRDDTNSDNIDDFGEVIKVDTELAKESQKLTVSNCGTPDQIVFEVDSTTGEVTIGNPDIPGADFTVNTSITLAGGCGTHKTEIITGNVIPDAGVGNIYSYHIRNISDADIDKVALNDNIRVKQDSITGTDILVTQKDTYVTEITKSPGNNTVRVNNALAGGTQITGAEIYIIRNERLTVTNGHDQPVFEVDSCHGVTKIGNTFRRADISEVYPASQTPAQSVANYTTLANYRVHSYWLDPTTQNGGGTTTLAGPVASHVQYDRQLTVQDVGTGEGAFAVGDLVMIGSLTDMANGTGFKEIMVVMDIDATTNVLVCNKAQEGTTEKLLTEFVVGDVVSRIKKHNETSVLTDLQERQRGSTPYLSAIIANGHIIQTKIDYFNWVRFENIDPNTTANSYFFVNSNMNGTVHQTTMDEEHVAGDLGFVRGGLDLIGDLTMTGGNLVIFDSVNQSRILYLGNDKGHADHGGNLQVDAGCTIRGNISVFPSWCPETILAAPHGFDESFKVDNLGHVTCGESLTVTGTGESAPAPSYKSFTVGNLGINGVNEFSVRRTGEIASFGIDPYWTKSGGIHTRYVSSGSDAADKILVPNIVYMANVTTDDTLVLTLPDAPITGDTVRIVEVGGDLSYKTSLVIRAPEASQTAIQGDNTGTLLGGRSSPYPSGELVVQTPNAGFTLIYLGSVASDGRVGIPTTDQGWWLMEV